MRLTARLTGKHYSFKSIKELLGRANEARSGDELAGVAARSERERIAAKMVLAELLLSALRNHPVVPYEADEVTRVIEDGLDRDAYNRIRNMSVGEFREWLLDDRTGEREIAAISK